MSEDKETKKKFAIKVLSKSFLIKEKKIHYAKVERDVMTICNHPSITRLYLTFQDNFNLYYVMELVPNGNLQTKIDEFYALSTDCVKVLMAQIICGIEHLHNKKILHRDLKPDNILLDDLYRAKICDFGNAKIFENDNLIGQQRGSFVGSPEYVSPELLKDENIGKMSDIWAFGCMLYKLIVGETPFIDESNYLIFQRIQNVKFKIPEFVPEDAVDLIRKILVLNPEERIGYNSINDIKNHPFFNEIDWEKVLFQKTPEFKSFEPALKLHQKMLKIKEEERKAQIGYDIILESDIKYILDGKELLSTLVLTDAPVLFICNLEKTKVIQNISLEGLKCYEENDIFIIENSENKFAFGMEKQDKKIWKEMISELLCD